LLWERIEHEVNQAQGKTSDKGKGKAPKSAHYVMVHCNIGVTEYLFNVLLVDEKIIRCLIWGKLAR